VPPVVVAAACWLFGTLAVHELPALPGAVAAVPLLLVVLLALRNAVTRPLVWFAAAVAWTAWCVHERLEERLPLEARGRDVAVTGWVDSFPTTAPRQATFAFRVAPPVAGVPERLRITWYDGPDVTAGAALALTVRLRPPHGARNPGGFDYEQWLLVNDFGATGYVRSGALAPQSAAWPARWQTFRATLAARLAAAAPSDDAAALLIALAIGERYRFSEQHWADFRRTGTSHLVAVSGMHVALLGLVVFAVLRWLCLRLPAPCRSFDLEAAAGGSVLATAYYAALTGFAVPAQRSLVMIAVALAVLVSRRSIGAAQALAATLLAVLAWDPFAPLTASFWLSFVAVAVLLALAVERHVPARGGAVQRSLRAMRGFVALQCMIGVALVPLTAWYFGEISLLGPSSTSWRFRYSTWCSCRSRCWRRLRCRPHRLPHSRRRSSTSPVLRPMRRLVCCTRAQSCRGPRSRCRSRRGPRLHSRHSALRLPWPRRRCRAGGSPGSRSCRCSCRGCRCRRTVKREPWCSTSARGLPYSSRRAAIGCYSMPDRRFPRGSTRAPTSSCRRWRPAAGGVSTCCS
jgi:ComEC/Rec2-related protein